MAGIAWWPSSDSPASATFPVNSDGSYGVITSDVLYNGACPSVGAISGGYYFAAGAGRFTSATSSNMHIGPQQRITSSGSRSDRVYFTNPTSWIEYDLTYTAASLSNITVRDLYLNPNDFSVGTTTIAFAVGTNLNEYPAFSSNLASESGTIYVIFWFSITKPQVYNYTGSIALYDGSTLVTTLTLNFKSLSSSVTTYPYSVDLASDFSVNAQNANRIISKPGYFSIGWDTNSSAQNVVYGGFNANVTIPENTIPVSYSGVPAPLKLYSVWLQREIYLVTGIDANNTPILTRIEGENIIKGENNAPPVAYGAIRISGAWRYY